MFKKHILYKHDHYNMLTIEVQGKTLVVREISDQWGEQCFHFYSRPALKNWAEKRFSPQDFPDGEEGLAQFLAKINQV